MGKRKLTQEEKAYKKMKKETLKRLQEVKSYNVVYKSSNTELCNLKSNIKIFKITKKRIVTETSVINSAPYSPLFSKNDDVKAIFESNLFLDDENSNI